MKWFASLPESSRSLATRAALLSLPFIAAYGVIRSLPVEACPVLHVEKTLQGGVEQYCGPDEADYIQVTSLRMPVAFEWLGTPVPDSENRATLSFRLSGPGGRPILYEDIAPSHGERIHLMAISDDLDDYHHVHPSAGETPGTFTVVLEGVKASRYRLFLEWVSATAGRLMVFSCDWIIGPEAHRTGVQAASGVQGRLHEKVLESGLRARLELDTLPVAGERFTFGLSLRSDTGQPVVFTPLMQSFAHVVIFDAELKGLAHAHPMGQAIALEAAADPELRFSVRLPRGGLYRLWVQFNANGIPCRLPFDLETASSATALR